MACSAIVSSIASPVNTTPLFFSLPSASLTCSRFFPTATTFAPSSMQATAAESPIPAVPPIMTIRLFKSQSFAMMLFEGC